MSDKEYVVRTQLQELLTSHGVEPSPKWTNSELIHAVKRLLIPQEREKNEITAVMIDALKHIETPPNMPPMVAELFKNAVGPRPGSMTRHLIDAFAEALAEGKVPGCDTH
jgi:hypothetical protein